MLIPSFFITELEASGDITGMSLPENAWPAYRIRINDSNHTRSLYHSLFSGKLKRPFCLSIEWEDKVYAREEWEALIGYAISIAFNYFCLHTSYNIPFLIFKGPDSHSAGVISLFREKFRAQGYSDMDYIFIRDDRTVSGSAREKRWIYTGPSTDPALITALYDSTLRGTSPHTAAFVFDCPPEMINVLTGRFTGVEDDLLRDSSVIHSLLYQTRVWEIRQKELLLKIAILQEKVDSLNNYYSFYNAPDSGYKKQVTEITEFYNKEYEILPMWYKKFGHVLKVLTGKRTFRSLYNDNVKKYKI